MKELEKMLKAAEDNGVILLEAMRSVFDLGFKAIEDNINKLGAIRRITFQYCQYSSRYDNFKKGIIENAFNPIFSNGYLSLLYSSIS
jgi:predicted dehydrogenase